MATLPNFTDLTKLPPKAGTFYNDTTLPKTPKPGLGAKILNQATKPRSLPGVGPVIKGAGKLAGRLALPAALLQSASSEVAPESKIFPKFGEIARINEENSQKLWDEGRPFAAVGETISNVLPAAGMALVDTKDFVVDTLGGLFNGGSETKPVVEPGKDTQTVVPPPPVATGSGPAPARTSKYDDLLLKQLNQEQPALPQRLPVTEVTQEQSPAYESPLATAAEKLKLARFDPRRDSFGDLLGARLQNVNEGGKLIPALAQTREMAEQQRRNEEDRDFGLKSSELGQNKAYQQGSLDLRGQELGETRRSSNIDNIVRLRGQDVAADTSRAVAQTRSAYATKPLTPKQQIENQDGEIELSLRQFPQAPPGFAEAVPDLLTKGYTRAQIQDAYNYVTAAQMKNTGTAVDALDPVILFAIIVARLGASQ